MLKAVSIRILRDFGAWIVELLKVKPALPFAFIEGARDEEIDVPSGAIPIGDPAVVTTQTARLTGDLKTLQILSGWLRKLKSWVRG